MMKMHAHNDRKITAINTYDELDKEFAEI